MIYLCNTFSVHMLPFLPVGSWKDLRISRISSIQAGEMLRNNAYRSFYGHCATAYHLERYLRITIPVSRGLIKLQEGDTLLIAAVTSKRRYEAGYRCVPGWRFYTVEFRPMTDDVEVGDLRADVE